MSSVLRHIVDFFTRKIVFACLTLLLAMVTPYLAIIEKAPKYLIFMATLTTLVSSGALFYFLQVFLKSLTRSATLRLQIYGDTRFPTIVFQENMFRYLYLRNIIVVPDTNGVRHSIEIVNLFISFQNDVAIRTLEVSSPDIALPQYEVKEYNQRYAVISFAAALPMGILEIRAGH
jgi:hypothetical protein